ncbi:Hpt [Desulforapulum autotrophicum HRM2]|uniref:Hypoxanthine phosphoribosyltransferase n=1 Tax=Desulforapulum autotrophicum (strain ATCC 43914 / DSM 3382 / VKM B-1955 / HRM2) TaxID=177437 RepID=C0QLJ4_DESAH|nr:hypoxanthine phosphoribosyltransferase [Desulforapulum autotrophicum]ACN16298.1 Hpt [Desulforapulum autotrophicum HRM2]
MTQLIPMISQEEIKTKVRETGRKISQDYKDKNLVLAGILKGSFIFLSDLTREITIDHEIDLIGVSSYSGTSSTGKITFTKKPDLDLGGKDVLLVEDIVDTGSTLLAIKDYLKSLNPASIKICSLIDKHERRKTDIAVDYACFLLDKGFIVGYGLDYNERYRNLPAIFDLKL